MKDNPNQIDPFCIDCKLHKEAHPLSVCLKGTRTEGGSKLMVFTDYPDYFADNAHAPYKMDVGKILDWMFRRMSIDPNLVAYDYTLRCYPKQNAPTSKAARAEPIEECSKYRFASIARVRPRSIAALGKISCEAFTGKSEPKHYYGRKVRAWEGIVAEYCPEVWIGYSIQYILVSPSDTHEVFRVLYCAAEDAGLKPKLNPSEPPFQWRNLK